MLIQSRTLAGAAAALAMVGAVLWGSAFLMTPARSARVEIQQIQERSWNVEVKDLSFERASADVRTAAAVPR